MDKRFKEIKYYEIDYNDFEKFIKETFGKEYESVADNEWNNYSSYDFDEKMPDRTPTGFYMTYTLRDVEAWKRGKKSTIDADSLLEYMVDQGILPEGKYLIKVFW